MALEQDTIGGADDIQRLAALKSAKSAKLAEEEKKLAEQQAAAKKKAEEENNPNPEAADAANPAATTPAGPASPATTQKDASASPEQAPLSPKEKSAFFDWVRPYLPQLKSLLAYVGLEHIADDAEKKLNEWAKTDTPQTANAGDKAQGAMVADSSKGATTPVAAADTGKATTTAQASTPPERSESARNGGLQSLRQAGAKIETPDGTLQVHLDGLNQNQKDILDHEGPDLANNIKRIVASHGNTNDLKLISSQALDVLKTNATFSASLGGMKLPPVPVSSLIPST
jgi:hypothetical protein